MKLKNKIKSGMAIAGAKVFNKKTPLAVRWNLTSRCNQQCLYCNLWCAPADSSKELSTRRIFSVIDEMSKLGTQRISFSGGEPLLRKDIGKIIDYCKTKDISVSMNSNGSLVSEKVGEIRNLDLIKLSLDGPKNVHEMIRGGNTYDAVIGAAEVCKKNNIRFTFATTLTKHNIGHIDFILEKARQFNTVVALQPLKELYRGKKGMGSISPSKEDFKKCIEKLIQLKGEGNIHIRNTVDGLNHIYNWPRYENITCAAGRIFCMVQPNGDVIPCDRIEYTEKVYNCAGPGGGFKKAFDHMPGVKCSGCGFCGSLELSYLMAFRLSALTPVRVIT